MLVSDKELRQKGKLMKLAFWTVTRGAGNIAGEYKEQLQGHLKGYDIDVFTFLNCNINCDILPNFLKANFV